MSRVQGFGSASTEQVLYSSHPAMFGNSPFMFVFLILLIPIFGLGLVFLFLWWLDIQGTTLTITNLRTILRRGIFSKFTSDILHQDVRNVQVQQSFFQRITGVGDVGISSSAQSTIEIEVSGIPSPENVRELIYGCRAGENPQPLQTVRSASGRSAVSPPPQPSPKPGAKGTPSLRSRLNSYFCSQRFRDKAQSLLDGLIHLTSFKWVSRLPDWAQPIVWGLLVSGPLVLMAALYLRWSH
jgi:hypothetical protein